MKQPKTHKKKRTKNKRDTLPKSVSSPISRRGRERGKKRREKHPIIIDATLPHCNQNQSNPIQFDVCISMCLCVWEFLFTLLFFFAVVVVALASRSLGAVVVLFCLHALPAAAAAEAATAAAAELATVLNFYKNEWGTKNQQPDSHKNASATFTRLNAAATTTISRRRSREEEEEQQQQPLRAASTLTSRRVALKRRRLKAALCKELFFIFPFCYVSVLWGRECVCRRESEMSEV